MVKLQARLVAEVCLAVSLTACCAIAARGQTVATWNVDGNGTWNVDGNWASSDGLFPNGVGAVASLTNDITANRQVTITSPVTVGTLAIGDATGTSAFTLAGSSTANTLTFDVSSGRATMTKSSGGNDTVSARVLLAKDFTFTNTSGGLVEATGAFNETGGTRNMLFEGTGGRFQFNGSSNVSGTLTVNGNTTVSVRHGATRLESISHIAITQGTFVLGDPSNRTVANNVINTAATLAIGGNAPAVATLEQTNFGSPTGNLATQTFAGLTLDSGYSRFANNTTGNNGPNQSNLDFGTTNFTRNAGAILHFVPLAEAFGTRTVTTATTASMDFGGTRLVIGAVTGGSLGALVQQDGTTGVWSTLTSSTNPAAPDANTFALYTSNTTAPASSNFASIEVRNATLTLSGTNTVGSGMVLLGNPATSNGATLTGGTIRSNTDELILMTPSSVNGFNATVGSVIADKDGSTPTKLTVGLAGASNTNFTRVILNAANTFSGETTVISYTTSTANYLQIGNSLALQNSTLNNSTSQGVVFSSGITTATFGGLAGSADQPLVNAAAGAVALRVGNNDASTTYSGVLSAAGSLEKIGTGALTLAGASTYSGATTVTEGMLRVNGSIASSSGVTVAAAGTLAGSGFVSAIGGSGLVSPGNSPGILTAPSVDLSSGIGFAFEFFQAGLPTWGNPLASGNDVLRLTDPSTPILGTATAANVFDIYFATNEGTYTGGLFTDRNTEFIEALLGATFNYYVQDAGGEVNFGGTSYRTLSPGDVSWGLVQIDSAAFADQTVTGGYTMQFVVVVPEPSGMLLAFGGLTAAALAVRRRRARA